MNIKKHIPNIITLLNLLCGCIALVFVSRLEFERAFLFVCLGIFLDFFDGFFARLFKVSSPLGLQLDSLADMVTSGVVPGYVMFQLFQSSEYDSSTIGIYSFIGFIVTLGACYRLANFNIDLRQTDSFIGLPTPANALFILSLPLIVGNNLGSPVAAFVSHHWFLAFISVVSALVMNAEIPLFSLKVKDFSIKKNALQIFFLAASVLLLFFFRYMGVSLIIVFYVLLSIVNNMFAKKI
jgi:CDP-diacylglycerol---serine O-phosphatidyltransferase